MKRFLFILFLSLFLVNRVWAAEVGGVVKTSENISVSSSLSGEFVSVTSTRALLVEPMIRVGLYKTTSTVKFMSDYYYDVYFGNKWAGTLSAGDEVQLNYDNGIYSISWADRVAQGDNFVQLVAGGKDQYFVLRDYERSLSGRGVKNFNAYRGNLEFRYSTLSKMPYVINELPLEEYIAGIAESSNDAAEEYIKALLVAARSYAYVEISSTTEKNLFDVFASTVDQLYLGYYSEQNMPRVKKFAEETRGEVVTYKSKPITTPYFSRSDGRTRSQAEVRGKFADVPWLKSVKCIYDKGKKKLGHGVGMSNSDAAKRAVKDGWNYIQILKYYYTGVEVERVYD